MGNGVIRKTAIHSTRKRSCPILTLIIGTPSPDPTRANCYSPQNLNRYSYVLNDSVNRMDPMGLDDRLVCDEHRNCTLYTDCCSRIWRQGLVVPVDRPV